MTRSALILAVESSCDETCAAVTQGRTVLSSIVASQQGLHDAYGGVVPELASRRHVEMVDRVIEQALSQAGVTRPDAIAVTEGPGLIGPVLVGITAAQSRSIAWDVPLRPVDHLVGHVASVFIGQPDLEPPFLCLLASGGHTIMVEVLPGLEMRLVGTTRDDAAGEAFDKGARLLELPMPGGPNLEQLATRGDPQAVPFTPAMVHHSSNDVSFSGLKTALVRAVGNAGGVAASRADLAAGYQRAIAATLCGFVRRAMDKTDQHHTLAVVGGVAANALIREEIAAMCDARGMHYAATPITYCGDNAAMVGVAATYIDDVAPSSLSVIHGFASSSLLRERHWMPRSRT